MSKQELELVFPSRDMEKQIILYKKEHFDYGDMQVHGTGGLAFFDSYEEWLNHINTIRNLNPKTGVQTSTFFSKRISDGKLIGCILQCYYKRIPHPSFDQDGASRRQRDP